MLALHKGFVGLSRLMAVLGGIVLAALILLMCLSVLGRTMNGWLHAMIGAGILPGFAEGLIALGVGPVNGDFELVETGIAFSIFAFIPFCQVTAGHASVDIFTNFLPRPVQRLLRMLAELLFAAALVVIANQLWEGLASKQRSGTTTFLLQFPIWWAYALSLIGAVAAAIVGCWMALVRVYETVTSRVIVPDEAGAEH